MKNIALVGKPNSGKSSLFNLFTGLNQKIGNYSGVTVEKKTGRFLDYSVIDLPGIKSLKAVSLEEQITKDAILDYSMDHTPIVFVANGMQLEDSLLLFSEIADLQVNAVVAINFKDDLDKNQIRIDVEKMSDQLGCPVVLLNSRTGDGLDELKALLIKESFKTPNAVCRSLYDHFDGDVVSNSFREKIEKLNAQVLDEDDFYKRQKIVASIVGGSVADLDKRTQFLEGSKKWDKILLNPFLGTLFFLGTMLVVFQAVFYLASYPMDWIDASFAAASEWVNNVVSIGWLASLLSDGVLAGLGGVLIFIPQIAILFFLLGLLEHSGYMARISFISNRLLTAFGLSGQSVIPLMSSWACAIPAIMSTRVINDPKERMAVIFASPLMTCSARLPVYTILIAIMIPNEGTGFFNMQGVMLLGLYLIGVVATLAVAYIVSRRTKTEGMNLWSLELPVYRIPNWRNVLYNVYLKTKAFVIDAGKVIFIVSIILWLLASFSPKSDAFLSEKLAEAKKASTSSINSKEAIDLEYSYAGYLGKFIEPAIEPLGYDWKIGIALISSFAAREVFVGSLSTIYSVGSEEESLVKTRMQNEINLVTGLPRFNYATCLSLLLFYVFALQCMSTMAIVKRETGGWKYPIIQFVVMFVLAYAFAFAAYRMFV